MNLDQTILNQLQELQKTVAKVSASMITKEDAKNFATKDDVKLLKAELKTDLKLFKEEFKTDLKLLKEEFEIDLKLLKEELKTDSKLLEKELIEAIKDSEVSIISSVSDYAADKKTVEDLERRVIKIERKIKVN